MKHIHTIENLHWLPKPNTVKTFISDTIPNEEHVTGSFVLVFKEGKLLLTKVSSRMWDIPGGHVEDGETITETAIREVLEETNVKIKNLSLIGFDELHVNGNRPEGYDYPFPTSYLAYFLADVDEMLDFTAEFETSEREFFTLEEAKEIPWVQNHMELCQFAFDYKKI